MGEQGVVAVAIAIHNRQLPQLLSPSPSCHNNPGNSATRFLERYKSSGFVVSFSEMPKNPIKVGTPVTKRRLGYRINAPANPDDTQGGFESDYLP